MVDRDLIASRLAEVATRVGRARGLAPETVVGPADDQNRWELIVFNLMLAAQASMDIASHLIADQRWPQADSLADSFRRLADHRVLTEPTVERMVEAVGFRNVVAHGYSSPDPQLTIAATTDGLHDLERFAGEVADWLSGPGNAGGRAD